MKKQILLLTALSLSALFSACSDSSDSDCKQECVGNTAYTCKNGQTIKTDCGNDICLNGACIPQHVCDANELRCDEGGIPQKCINNAWENQPACGPTQTCKNGFCELKEQTEACTDGNQQCTPAGIPQKCVNKVWLNQTACAQGTTCKNGICEPDEAQTVCTTDAKRCSATNIPQKCINNAWVDQAACAQDAPCKDGICTKNPPAENKPPREQLMCEKSEQAKCQTTSDGHVWAVICHDGDVEDDDWAWPEDCSAVGLACVSEKVAYSDGEGTYIDAWCKCNSNADCEKAYPGENLVCVDNYCEEKE